jgi:RNA polymerase sigma factor (sigma-70 family)
VTDPGTTEDLLRELAPQVLAVLLRRYGYGQFHLCEDAAQEALLDAAVQWPADGQPGSPRGWLVTVATRRLLDQVRSERSRRQREERIAVASPQSELLAAAPDADAPPGPDDSLILLFGCCHPAISTPSQVALTLRAIGGLSTAQVAAAFGVPEATMAQRISRAKQNLRQEDFTLPAGVRDRLAPVLHVLYLIFSEGYTPSDGDAVTAPALCDEAIRLARWLRRLLPDEPEVAGLLALMLLTDARRPARTAQDGVSLVPLAEQDRSRWNRAKIDEGTTLITAALAQGSAGPYQLQAAIAAVHDEAETMDDTDWPQILGLYDLLELAAPNPFTTLNRAVAAGLAHGPLVGLNLLDTLQQDKRMAKHHRLLAARAHLLELAGEPAAAAQAYAQAARLSACTPERRYLTAQAKRLRSEAEPKSLGVQLVLAGPIDGGDDPLDDFGEFLDLGAADVVDGQAPHCLQMTRPRLRQALESGVSQGRQVRPAIERAYRAPHPPLELQVVDDAGDSAGRQSGTRGQVGHPQLPAGRLGQL